MVKITGNRSQPGGTTRAPRSKKLCHFPINSNETEARKISRSVDFKQIIMPTGAPANPVQTTGDEIQSGSYLTKTTAQTYYEATAKIINPEFPHRMDLRRNKKR